MGGVGWLEHRQRCRSSGWEELGVGWREDQELGFGWVKFEMPLGHPGGDVESAEIQVGVWILGEKSRLGM